MLGKEKLKVNRKKTSVFVKAAIFCFAVFAVISVVDLQFQYNDYKAKRDQLKADIGALEQQAEQLQNQLDTPIDDEYIVKVAEDKLSLRLPEEIIFYNDLYKD